MTASKKKCLSCKRLLQGRTDKKFCDDYCRSTFNNRKYILERGFVRNVNLLLLKNRRILAECLPKRTNTCPVNKEWLLSMGFRFNYFTHTQAAKEGAVYYCCYDHAYQWINDRELLVLKLTVNKQKAPTLSQD